MAAVVGVIQNAWISIGALQLGLLAGCWISRAYWRMRMPDATFTLRIDVNPFNVPGIFP